MNERALHDIETYPFWRLDDFAPTLPPGRIDAIYTHWSAHDYHSVFPAYHFCVATAQDGSLVVANTHDVTENMRDVTGLPHRPYAQHTRGRNSFALGISMMAMEDSRPEDFGAFPITEALIDGLCRVGAYLAKVYDVPIDAAHVMSHAEAAVIDGYFGANPNERWDIARLAPAPQPLEPQDAIDVGDALRSRMRGN